MKAGTSALCINTIRLRLLSTQALRLHVCRQCSMHVSAPLAHIACDWRSPRDEPAIRILLELMLHRIFSYAYILMRNEYVLQSVGGASRKLTTCRLRRGGLLCWLLIRTKPHHDGPVRSVNPTYGSDREVSRAAQPNSKTAAPRRIGDWSTPFTRPLA